MVHSPLKTRVVGLRIKAETRIPGHTMRDNHRASPTLVVQIQWDLTGALSPSGVRHTYRLPLHYTTALKGLMTVSKGSFTRAKRHGGHVK